MFDELTMGPLTNTASRLLQASDLIPTQRGCFTVDITFDLLKHPLKAKFTYLPTLRFRLCASYQLMLLRQNGSMLVVYSLIRQVKDE